MWNWPSASNYLDLRPHSPTTETAFGAVLESNGDIVAMTGDGVNDAPAIKAALYRHSHGRAWHGMWPARLHP